MKYPAILRLAVMSLMAWGIPTLNAEPAVAPAPKLEPAEHAQLAQKGWAALDAGKHEEALKFAVSCIKNHAKAAAELQKELTKDGIELATGAVSAEAKKAIHANGVLNDVAACHIIAAQANAALGKKDAERQSYRAAKELTMARVWDPQGWFWSPAEAAAESDQ